MEIFGLEFPVRRWFCAVCISLDSITITLLFLSFQNPGYLLSFLFMLGISYDGVAREIQFDLLYYNYLTHSQRQFIRTLYWILGILLEYIAFVVSGILGVVAFSLSWLAMIYINGKRYQEAEKYGMARLIYDVYFIMLAVFGIIIFLYV